MDEILDAGLAFVAEENETIEGFALARRKRGTHGVLTDLYVRPEARRKGVATALTTAVAGALAEMGATHVTLSVDVGNAPARAAYASWGFREEHLTLVSEIGELERLASTAETGPSFRFRPSADRRHRCCHARGRAVHPAADRTLGGDGRRAAAQWLDRCLRRGRRPRAGAPPPAWPRAVRPDGRRDPLDRRRARAGRPLPALRARADRGRVPVRPSALWGARAGRRGRPRSESDGSRAADGRRPARDSPDRAHGCLARRSPAGTGAPRRARWSYEDRRRGARLRGGCGHPGRRSASRIEGC